MRPEIFDSADRYTRREEWLAPFAIRGAYTKGRRFLEPPHSFRLPFQRDRDRIIHSRAFRRLEYKTQVFLNSKGDHYRTRLTHTIEVVAIARTIARGLAVNEDLTEAIALAHDLGHTPFGHVGERVLDELLKESGGSFDHNEQSLRVVDCLEKKYPAVDGLNLTWEVRAGLVKRRGKRVTLDAVELPLQASVEAQIADLADDVAYFTHDVDDGLRSGLLTQEALAGCLFWRRARDRALADGADPGSDYFAPYVVRCVIDMLVGDAIAWTEGQVAELQLRTTEQIGKLAAPVVAFSPAFRDHSAAFRKFLFDNVYWHKDVLDVNYRCGDIIRELFAHFVANPADMSPTARARIDVDGLPRAAADYIAGMTDRYALIQYEQLFGKGSGLVP